jgi:two-component system phosphate regulon sensor histidine kinase PhoR
VRLDVRTKLFLVSLTSIAVSVLAGELYLRPTIERDLIDRIRGDMLLRLAFIQGEAAALIGTDDKERWDALADRLGRQGKARVSFIQADGVMLGDSEVPAAALPQVENHRNRPEVIEALAGRSGSSMRWSATIGRRLMYVAAPLARDGQVLAVARLAVPITEVDDAITGLRKTLLIGMGVALGVALLLSSGAAHFISQALRRLTHVARQMSEGDLTIRTRMTGRDEVAVLGRALDGLAESLSATLTTLRAERDLLGRILESMQEGVLVADRAQRILLVNPGLRAMLLLPADVTGKTPLEVIRNADLQNLLDTATAVPEGSSGEIEIGGPKPRRLMVHTRALAGEAGGMLAVFVDVTAMRKLESMRRDFVANVSHELRTPIAAVVSASETLRGTALHNPEIAARFVSMIDRNAHRLHQLVEDLLDLSRIEAKEVRLAKDPVDLAAVINQAASLFRERIEQKRIRIAVAVDAGVQAQGDGRALEQILSNLLENAVKYCPDDSAVTISARVQRDKVKITVEDTGPGIEAKHLGRVFERFYRVDPGRSRDMGGTGLGLSIVKHLTEGMGGAVGVDSMWGKGTTFWLTVPLDPGTASGAATLSDSSRPSEQSPVPPTRAPNR